MFGRRQEIEIGPMSGASNVIYWLKQHGIESTPDLVQTIIVAAKNGDHVLRPEEVTAIVNRRRDTLDTTVSHDG